MTIARGLPHPRDPKRIGPDHARGLELTAREREIIDLLAEGRTAVQIAQALGISHKTVDAHRSNAYRRLGVHTVEAAIAATKRRERRKCAEAGDEAAEDRRG